MSLYFLAASDPLLGPRIPRNLWIRPSIHPFIHPCIDPCGKLAGTDDIQLRTMHI